jgi:hypothetical protein
MGDKIFSDLDLTVHIERNPVIVDQRDPSGQTKFKFEGLVYTLTCQDCEVPIKVGVNWKEVKHLLDGGQLPGVTRVDAGWQVTAQCANSNEGCDRKNTFLLTDSELENEANMELARRKRVIAARHGGQVVR